MSRYKQSRKATNRDEMYKDVFDQKGVKSITQFRSEKLKRVDEKIKQKIRFSIQSDLSKTKMFDSHSEMPKAKAKYKY